MDRSPAAVRRWMVRGALAVILATVVLVTAGTIAFWVLRPYRERVVDYAPSPATHTTRVIP